MLLRSTRRTVSVLIGAAIVAVACAEIDSEELTNRYQPDSREHSETPPPGEEADAGVDAGEYDVDCGTISIPGDGKTRAVELAFARFNASGNDPHPDPVVYLHGGPGGAVLADAGFLAHSLVDPFVEDRDVILDDQRGAGASSPLPECFEVWGLDEAFVSSDIPHQQLRDDYTAALIECADRVNRRDTIDLTAYASATHADDFLNLVRALGYDSINLYANSYGTRLAQIILRDHGAPIRAAILSGVYPIEANLVGSAPAAFEWAFRAIADACIATPRCERTLPDPVASFRARRR